MSRQLDWWYRQMDSAWKRRAALLTLGLLLYPLFGVIQGLLIAAREWVEDFQS